MNSNDFWAGAFVKHRYHPKTKHPEHLPNHVQIVSMTLLDDEERVDYDEDIENDLQLDMLTELGDGEAQYLVAVHFAGDEPDMKYDYIVNAPIKSSAAARAAMELICEDVAPSGDKG